METGNDAVFILTKEDVIECAREMGIPAEAITDDVLAQATARTVAWRRATSAVRCTKSLSVGQDGKG